MPKDSPFDPAMPVAEQIKVEALAHSRRREAARQLSATVKGPGAQAYRFSDSVTQLVNRLDVEEELERRREEERQLRTPSGLIRCMNADWPDHANAVKRAAKRLGIGLGEAWAMAIETGANSLGKKPARKA